jgi:basic amino acid/polyamine antiporter, APA family
MALHSSPTLRRVLSRWDLLAYGINCVIGGAIFLIPATIAAHVGNWGPIAFVAAGFASLASALCIRQNAWLINALTIGKLVPLAVFLAVGLVHVNWSRLAPLPPLSAGDALAAALLLAFAFGGYDTLSIPAGEAKNPRRDLPFAFIATIVAVTVIMALVQVIVTTTLTTAARSTTPVADAARTFMGPLGAAMIGIGAVLSMTGNNAGSLLSGSRLLFALAKSSQLPAFLAYIHPGYRMPVRSIWLTTAVVLVLALSGSFTLLAAASAVARLLTYAGVAAATVTLRDVRFLGRISAPTFVVPFGAAIPVISFVLSLVIIAGANARQLLVGGTALVIGSILFLANEYLRRGAIATGVSASPTTAHSAHRQH